MKALYDRPRALSDGLAAIREQFQLPARFPPEVEAAAADAASQPLSGHVDRTDLPFVTLDPLSSTDLDQAFAIEQSGGDLILRYAIADIGWFVPDGGPIDAEAWARGETIYLPDGKVSLYPPALSEGAASLLADADKPAILFPSASRPMAGQASTASSAPSSAAGPSSATRRSAAKTCPPGSTSFRAASRAPKTRAALPASIRRSSRWWSKATADSRSNSGR